MGCLILCTFGPAFRLLASSSHTYHSANHHFKLSVEPADALRSLSSNQGVTLFMTLLAAFQIVIFRCTQHPDIIIGTAVSSCRLEERENVTGCFANNLPLRTDFSTDLSAAAPEAIAALLPVTGLLGLGLDNGRPCRQPSHTKNA